MISPSKHTGQKYRPDIRPYLELLRLTPTFDFTKYNKWNGN